MRLGGTDPVVPRNRSIWARSPTRTTVRSGEAERARRAPATFGPGPWSPPMASSASRMCLLPLLGLVHVHHFTPLVRSAVRAHPVRQDRLVALRAVLDLHRRDVMM